MVAPRAVLIALCLLAARRVSSEVDPSGLVGDTVDVRPLTHQGVYFADHEEEAESEGGKEKDEEPSSMDFLDDPAFLSMVHSVAGMTPKALLSKSKQRFLLLNMAVRELLILPDVLMVFCALGALFSAQKLLVVSAKHSYFR